MMKKYWVFPLVILTALGFWVAVIIRRLTNPRAVFNNPQKGKPKPGLSSRVIDSGGIKRGFLLYVPSGYKPGVPLPLVLNLHGFASSASGQMHLSRWEKLAEKENFCVIYPQGTGSPLRWNASRDFTISAVDDVSFIQEVIQAAGMLLDIDPSRIYVSGMSNGGSMTARLAWELPGIFAAAGIVSAPPIDLAQYNDSTRPIPLIAFYGTADPLVKYEGGMINLSPLTRLLRLSTHHIKFPPVRQWIETWVKRNGASASPKPIALCEQIIGLYYSGRVEASEVEFYAIIGGGHTWPGGAPTFIGKTNRFIDATVEMWEFFKRHSTAAK